MVRADIENFADGFALVHQLHQRADYIADVTETARLFAIAVNSDGPTRKRLLHEAGDHHAVLSRLPWADGIEETHDRRRQFLLAPVSEREKFVDCFRASIAPAAFRRRAHDQIA